MAGGEVRSDFFDTPALKVFARQLQNCRYSDHEKLWLVPLKHSITGKEKNQRARLFWLQGTVHAIINATCVVLRDATGLVKIGNLERIPAAGVPVSQWLAKGLYCCVVGELTSSGSGKTPVVTAAKFTSLDDEPHAQSLWNWEVRDLADHLVDWADE